MAGRAWRIAGCQGDIVSLDVWACLVGRTHLQCTCSIQDGEEIVRGLSALVLIGYV